MRSPCGVLTASRRSGKALAAVSPLLFGLLTALAESPPPSTVAGGAWADQGGWEGRIHDQSTGYVSFGFRR